MAGFYMKIIYCIYSTSNSGGMERVVIAKANYLARLGHEISILTTEQKGCPSFFSIDPSIKTIDFPICYSDDNSRNFIVKFVNYFTKLKLHRIYLTKYLQTHSVDIVISTFGNEFSFLYKIVDGSKKILEIHFSKYFRRQFKRKGLWYLADIYRSYLDEKIVSYYDKFVVLTEEDKLYWKNCTNIIVIPNFVVDLPAKRAQLNNKICVSVGRLTYQKGYDNLIKIWSLVHRKYPDWKLNIYGAGELDAYLHTMIAELNLEKIITIHAPTNQIAEEYLKSSIYLLTSRFEGLPMVLLEAFSFGLPVVSYTCKCGPRDLISDGYNGFLVSENEIEEFASKIIFLIENRERRIQMGEAALQTSCSYKKESIMKRWIDLFCSFSK